MQNGFPQTQRPRIAVIGDIMVDIDLHCRCKRIAQEGPWPVFAIDRIEKRLGGAGNVAEMVFALGAETLLMGLVGADWQSVPGSRFMKGWLVVSDRLTTSKSRIWVDGKQVGPRIDQDLLERLTGQDVAVLLENVRKFAPAAIIVADHGKGVVTAELMRQLGRTGIPLFIDPVAGTPIPEGTAAIAGGPNELGRDAHRATCVIEKHGPHGLVWHLSPQSYSEEPLHDVPSACRNLVDPLGAGDQFIAALAYQRCLGTDWPDAIEWADVAAGIQCERLGCHPVSFKDAETRFTGTTSSSGKSKCSQPTWQ